MQERFFSNLVRPCSCSTGRLLLRRNGLQNKFSSWPEKKSLIHPFLDRIYISFTSLHVYMILNLLISHKCLHKPWPCTKTHNFSIIQCLCGLRIRVRCVLVRCICVYDTSVYDATVYNAPVSDAFVYYASVYDVSNRFMYHKYSGGKGGVGQLCVGYTA